MRRRLSEETSGVDPRVRLLAVAASVVFLALPVRDLVVAGQTPNFGGYGGVDFDLYMQATNTWLSTGHFYNGYQLAGPYPITAGDILYPPVALWLFVPFTVMPSILWWAIPIGAVVGALLRIRPDPRAWPILALCIAWPPTLVKLVTGNPVMWVVAAVALGVLYAWPAVFALIKPSLFPIAFVGANRRSWWVALMVLVVVSLPFGPLWGEWVTTVVNSQGGGVAYSIQELPLVALPIIAGLASSRRRPLLSMELLTPSAIHGR